MPLVVYSDGEERVSVQSECSEVEKKCRVRFRPLGASIARQR